ncbi:SDR family NAD(P)-dependent oxidoreductase [Amycolatopsis sp. NPDC049868]|uniref:SDR family NAD(P)-dependent oxidoreductase n=1 Tax=Amycolatopsis sp. NPDC049868 TaxID=3363934 RepID=UPI0037929642
MAYAEDDGDRVAIIGIGCRFPGGATGPASLWKVLADGTDAIREVPRERWDIDHYFADSYQQAGRMNSRFGGFLDQVDHFDAAFFDIPGRVAEQMDPQQRLLLEVCWEGLEDAGIAPDGLARSRTGVFVGACSQDYSWLQVAPQEIEGLGTHSATGMYMSILSNRLSYTLDLRGPSMTIDTACSSSLVAVHQACQSLRRGESTLAIVGGVNVMLAPQGTIALSQAAMLSPEGRSKAFDATADGYVRGEGAGVVVLKPLRLAQADGDRIYAVIAGTAVNQDGSTQGITVPNDVEQEANFRAALADAGVAERDIGYVEAHGTGTPVGDPLEAAALGRTLAVGREPERIAFVGSIKTNIGHLEGGAGIAGLIKAALSVHHRRIPPSLHFAEPHPEIDFERWRMRVPQAGLDWPSYYERPVAAVNSFGFGGTNANAILMDPPEPTSAPVTPEDEAAPALLTLSARSEPALRLLAAAHADRVASGRPDLHRLGANLALRRSHHRHRLAVTATTPEAVAAELRAYAEGKESSGAISGEAGNAGKLAFVFNGQGPQWFAMGRELLETSQVFRATIMECDRVARQYLDWSIHEALTAADEQSSPINHTHCLQPTMFALQVALVELLKSTGLEPDGVTGHSMGEITAAYVSGALDLETALKVICRRAAIQELADPTGGMLFAAVDRAEALTLCEQHPGALWLSAVNSPDSSTLSGRREVLKAVADELEGRGVFTRLLRVNCACHSPDMDPLCEKLLEELDGVKGGDTTIPMYSTVSGRRVSGAVLSAPYWWENFRQPVLFSSAIQEMADDGFDTFIELSPHPVLGNAINESLRDTHPHVLVLSSLKRGANDWDSISKTLGKLYVTGRDIRWNRRYPAGAPAMELPTNPWIRERFWHESELSRKRRIAVQSHPMLRPIDAPRPTWEVKWGDHRLSWVLGHEVFDNIVVPGASYLEGALVSARSLTGDLCGLEFVEYERPCVLTEGQPQITRIELDPDEGTFDVHSRSVREDTWIRNARGRFRRIAAPDLSAQKVDLDAIRARCRVTRDGADVSGALRRAGYAYGPAFTGISRLHIGTGESLALVETPHVLTDRLTGYLFHPALLDACLQVAILNPSEDRPGELIPYSVLPTGIDRVRVYGEITMPVWCHSRVRKLDTTGFSVDVQVFDGDGQLLAELMPIRGKLVRESATTDTGAELQQLVWRSRGRTSSEVRNSAVTLGPDELQAALEPMCGALADRLRRRTYGSVYQTDMRALCAAYVAECLTALGHQPVEGTVFSVQDYPDVLPRYERAFAGFLRFLVEDGFLSEHDARFRVERDFDLDPRRQWADMVDRYPSCLSELQVIRETGGRLGDILSGRIDPLELLFPAGSASLIEPIYRNSPVARFYNQLVTHAVRLLADTADSRRTLRVLEVGGGTGGLTAGVLPALPTDRYEYLFTDLSETLVQSARERYRDEPVVECRTLDLERDLTGQGLEAGSFDLVVASDVVHATTDVTATLRRIRQVVAPGGVLAMIEATPGNRWLDLSFGLTSGWWLFQDTELREDGPLLPSTAWQERLRAAGYDQATALGDPGHIGAGAQAVLLARTPVQPEATRAAAPGGTGPERCGAWLIAGESTGLGADLGRRITERGGRPIFVRHGDSAEWTGDSATVRRGHPEDYAPVFEAIKLEGVLHLGNTASATAAPDMLYPAIRDTCLEIVDLTQALSRAAHEDVPRLVLITRGAHPFRTDTVHLESAPTWGLGLVAGLEIPESRCTMIDLDGEPAAGEGDAVWAELWRSGHEHEIALRGGERFVRRLVTTTAAEAHAPTASSQLPAGSGFALQTPVAGALDNLTYQVTKRPAPGSGEVEIEVLSAGLNFIDVMTALGQVPQLESSRSYRFGTECAGVVTRVGDQAAQAYGLRIGDPVVAISSAQGTLASHITLDAVNVVAKPEGLSFDEAASVPVVFLTAWHTLRTLTRLQPGERILIHSATGGTGLAAIQVARLCGAEVFATAGSPARRELLRSLGVPHVMDSRTPAFADEIMAITGGAGVDVVLSASSGEALARNMSCLAPFGRFVEIGKHDSLTDRKLGLRSFTRNLTYIGFDLRHLLSERPRAVRDELGKIFDLMTDCTLRPVPHRVFHPSEAGSALRQLSTAQHVGKLIVAMDQQGIAARPPRSSNLSAAAQAGTWLVTGGLGGVGSAMADALADAGVQHLVLVGRTGAQDRDQQDRITDLRDRGVHVLDAAVDVTSRSAMADLLVRIDRELPPLRGVLHCAMVLDDALLADLDESRLDRVLGPKVQGAWNLHELTADRELEAFVLFSSATSLIGNRGQANYAAANAFLDHLAQVRRASGRHALSVNLGAITDVGYVARHKDVARAVAARGMRGTTAQETFGTLMALLTATASQVGMVRMDWPQFFRRHGITVDTQPRYQELTTTSLAPAEFDAGTASGTSLRRQLQTRPEAEGLALLTSQLRARIATVLGVPSDELEEDTSLANLLDSLLTVEINSWIERELGVRLRVMDIMKGMSITQLAAQILNQAGLSAQGAHSGDDHQEFVPGNVA